MPDAVSELVAWAALAAALAVGGGVLWLHIVRSARDLTRNIERCRLALRSREDEVDQLYAERNALTARLNAILVLQQSRRESQTINDGV